MQWFVKHTEESFLVSHPVLLQTIVFSLLVRLLVYVFVLQTPGIVSRTLAEFQKISHAMKLSILAVDVDFGCFLFLPTLFFDFCSGSDFFSEVGRVGASLSSLPLTETFSAVTASHKKLS